MLCYDSKDKPIFGESAGQETDLNNLNGLHLFRKFLKTHLGLNGDRHSLALFSLCFCSGTQSDHCAFAVLESISDYVVTVMFMHRLRRMSGEGRLIDEVMIR